MPKAFGGIDAYPMGLCAAAAIENFLVDVAESVERFALVFFIFVTPRAEIASEQLLIFFDVFLRDLRDKWSA